MCLQCLNLVYSLFLYTVWTFAMDFEHFNNIARNSLKQQNLQKLSLMLLIWMMF